MNFLQKTATQIWNEYQHTIRDHLFLFPSRRSMLYFKRALTEAAGQPLWVPDCLTLDQWVMDQTELIPADAITNSYSLYKAALKVDFVNYDFELFYPLAQIILNDFEEVDMALIDPDTLWVHTSHFLTTPDHPQAQFWADIKDTDLKRTWEVNWNKLNNLYKSYSQILGDQGLSTKGGIFRETVKQKESVLNAPYPRIHVIGFSSLRQAEVEIFKYIRDHLSVQFYWNFIPTMDAPGFDSGSRVKRWMDYFGQDLQNYLPELPQIEVVSAPGMIAQMKLVSQVLEFSGSTEDQMAVVLPHPSLIDNLLTAFPENRSRVNISMGYPLIYSSARSMVDWILGLWEAAYNRDQQIEASDLELISKHVYIQNYLTAHKIPLNTTSKLYFAPEELVGDDPLLQLLFTPLDSVLDSLNRLVQICEIVAPIQKDLFHREVLRFVRGRLVRLHDILSQVSTVTFDFLRRIALEMMQESSIPFRGEPMQGVQVLGLQEVQNLSFDTLIVPGLNEEVLPSGKLKSMIPFSLRRLYKLEDLSAKLSTQSYYLWSAILQARRVYLLHSQGSDFLGSKGLSRYLFQLKYGGVDLPLSERHLELDLAGFEPTSKEIFLNKRYEERLLNYLQNEGLSATAVESYVTCPFQFFLRYVLRIKEDDQTTAGLDYRQMGSAIHDVMQNLYMPWLEKTVQPEDFEKIFAAIPEVTKTCYSALYPRDRPDILEQGVHWVEQKIILQAVERIVEKDRQNKHMYIDRLEADGEVYIDTSRVSGVRLRGKIDRVDRIDDVYRIIDYKTGTSRLNKSPISANWEKRNPVQNWQLLFYGYLLKDHLQHRTFELGHYTLKDKNLYAPMHIGQKTTYSDEDLEEFGKVLIQLIDEMTDPETPFQQTSNTNHCKYCVFNTFCERQSS